MKNILNGVVRSIDKILNDLIILNSTSNENTKSVQILEESGVEVKKILKSENVLDSLNRLLNLMIKVSKIKNTIEDEKDFDGDQQTKIECILKSILALRDGAIASQLANKKD